MKFQIIFERAGDGSPSDRDRVRNGLIQKLRVPSETADQMVNGAPLVVKQDLTQEQADSYRQALEGVGVVVTVKPMPEEPPLIFLEPVVETAAPGQPPPPRAVPPPTVPPPVIPPPVRAEPPEAPVFEDNADWWMSLRIIHPPFDEPRRGASPLTAGKVRLHGDAFTLSHPMLDRIFYPDILAISVFRTEAGRHYIDLYCPGQNRPVRLDHELIVFSSFGLPETESPLEAMYYFTRYLIRKNGKVLVDLPTFRFLRDLEGMKTVQNERDVEKYIARLTADLLAPETSKPGENHISAFEAEKLRDAVDPWIPPPPQPMLPPMMGVPVDPANPYGQPVPMPPEGYPGMMPGMPPGPPGMPMNVAPPGAAPPIRTGPLSPPPGMAPPPGMMPPPGIAPPPGMMPPPGIAPPPGMMPPPGIAPPPGVMPPPGVAPPPGMYPAPPYPPGGMPPPMTPPMTGPQPVFVPPQPPPLPPIDAGPLVPKFISPGTEPLSPADTISTGINDTVSMAPAPPIEISLPGIETLSTAGIPDVPSAESTQTFNAFESAPTIAPGSFGAGGPDAGGLPAANLEPLPPPLPPPVAPPVFVPPIPSAAEPPPPPVQTGPPPVRFVPPVQAAPPPGFPAPPVQAAPAGFEPPASLPGAVPPVRYEPGPGFAPPMPEADPSRTMPISSPPPVRTAPPVQGPPPEERRVKKSGGFPIMGILIGIGVLAALAGLGFLLMKLLR